MKLILLLGLVLIALSNVNGEYGEERWSGCWTHFTSASTICRSELGDEFEDVRLENCGLLGMGKRVLCRRLHVGCKATTCYSALVKDLCHDQFGDDFPVKRGAFNDCTLGFHRFRCCPRCTT